MRNEKTKMAFRRELVYDKRAEPAKPKKKVIKAARSGILFGLRLCLFALHGKDKRQKGDAADCIMTEKPL